jgi:hypothetical protein
MITQLRFHITPDRILFPDYPEFDLAVGITDTGWVFEDLEYGWSCLPGYMRESYGVVEVVDTTDVGGAGYEFYLCGAGGRSNGASVYGELHSVPRNYAIGSTGSSVIDYGGSKVKGLLKGKSDATLYSDWKLVNAY